ncbi:serine hydrolase domain-containing protein, partial [Steroidobacter sp.]|uniref:serine hydrolase domain-containing protein n=1 Tax=Steroidobacter sp. TaxID=1978227 RepID=UPI001A6200EC
MTRWMAGVALLVVSSAAAIAADRFDGARTQIRERMLELSVPSVAVAVAKDGRILWEEGFGWADRERRLPANAQTLYSVASISKPLTATGLMTLVKAGKVDLDRPANDYLSGARIVARVGDASGATLRRIANHTSGLPTYHRFFYRDEAIVPPSMDEVILRYGNLLRVPGERVVYSNLGFGLLGHIIEQVSGESYAEYMRREVFLPLAMTRSSVGVGSEQQNVAVRYGDDRLPLPAYSSDTEAAGAIYSSVHDLVRFGMFQLKAHHADQKAILSDAAIDEMQRRSSVLAIPGVPEFGFGVSFLVQDKFGYRVVGHAGSMSGVSAQLYLVPEEGVVIVAVSNLSWPAAFDVPDIVAGSVLPRWKRNPPAMAPVPTPPVSTAFIGQWHGNVSTYQGEMPLVLTFAADGTVLAKLGDQLTALVNDSKFSERGFSGRFAARMGTSDTAGYNHVIGIDLDLRGETLTGMAHTQYWNT